MNPYLLSISNWFLPTLAVLVTALILGWLAFYYYRRSQKIEEMKIASITEENIVQHIYSVSKVLGLQAVISSRAQRVLIRGQMSLTNGAITMTEFFRKGETFFKILVKDTHGKVVPLFIQESSGDYHLGRKSLHVREQPEDGYVQLPHILIKDDPGPEENAPPSS